MERIFKSIPNIAFHKIVKDFAFYSGKPCFTLRDLDSALINYTYIARKNN